MNKLLDEYLERFGEQFPLMIVRGMSEAEIVAILKKCLESGKPYEPELVEGADY